MTPSARSLGCPSEDSVVQFFQGSMSGERLAEMERHLDTCDVCARVAAQVARSHPSAPDRTPLPAWDGEDPPLMPDARVGRYAVRRRLGEGAMGRVYLAWDPTLDRTIALKLLRTSAADPALEARLLREAKAMGRLARHPEIVAVYDAGRHEEQLFIAMEFLDGGTLRAWLEDGSRAWPEIVALFQRAGRGLAHAHAAGIVHRDFKPDNVLVGRDGRVCVTDFGLARVSRDVDGLPPPTEAADGPPVDASLTRTGTLVGTPAYMAPEQLEGGSADVASDVFSFCVALYEALYGERPFHGTTLAQLRVATRSGLPSARRDRKVPRRLHRVLERGLQPSRELRHPSMAELLADIDQAIRVPGKRVVLAGGLALAVVAAIAGRALLEGDRRPVSWAALHAPADGTRAAASAPERPAASVPVVVEETASSVSFQAPPSSSSRPSPAQVTRRPASHPIASEPAPIVQGKNDAPIIR
jgi:serine/threonine protein kinase